MQLRSIESSKALPLMDDEKRLVGRNKRPAKHHLCGRGLR
jgi:hypothetical protein